MGDCIFCKIANGEIPAATLYEDEDFRVILVWVRQVKVSLNLTEKTCS